MSQSLTGPLISTDVNNPAQCCCGGPWVLALPCMDGLVVGLDGEGYCPAGEDNYDPPCLWVKYKDVQKTWDAGSNFYFFNNGDKRVCYNAAPPQTPIDLPEGATIATNIATNNGCGTNTCTECPFCCGNSAPIAMEVAPTGLQLIPNYSGSFPGGTLYLQASDSPFGLNCVWLSQVFPNAFTYTNPVTGAVTTYGAQWEYDALGGGLIGLAPIQNADGSFGPDGTTFFWGFSNNLVPPDNTQRDCNNPGSPLNGIAGGGSVFSPGLTVGGVGSATLTPSPPDTFRSCPQGSGSGSGSTSGSSSGSASGDNSGSSSGSNSGSSSGSHSGSSSGSGSHSGSSGSHSGSSGSTSNTSGSGSNGSTGNGSGGGAGGGGSGTNGHGSGAIGDTGSGSAGIAPTVCTCCASFALTLSGGTAADGTVSLQYLGNCFWGLGPRYQLFADDYAWIAVINYGFWHVTFVAPLSDCPPDTGWTVWSSSATGDPELTLSCSTTSGGSGSGSGSGSSSSCISTVACAYCDDSTPTVVEVQFADVALSSGCISCADTSYSLSGTINSQSFLLSQDPSNSCRWFLTTTSSIQVLKYFSTTCSGSVVDVSGPLTISLVVESSQTSLVASVETTDGYLVLLFSTTFANIGCSVAQTVYSILSYTACGSTSEFQRLYAATGGSAAITPCGGTNTIPTCLYNTGQTVTANGFTTGPSSPCDSDNAWTYNGTPAAAPATQWYPYAFTNTATARWIGAQCDGHGQTTGLGNFNEVTFTIPAGTDLTSFSLTGQFSADNWLDTVSVNSVGLDIGFYGTPSGVYGTYQGYGSVQSYCEANGIGTPNDFGGLNPFTLPTSAAWRIGTNTVLFSVGGNDDFGGLVVVWDTPCGDDGLKFKTSQQPALPSRPRPSCKSCVRRKAA